MKNPGVGPESIHNEGSINTALLGIEKCYYRWVPP